MAKILDSNTITGAIQKVVETNNYYIINGNACHRDTLIPKPLKLIPTLANDVKDLSMNKKLILNHTIVNHGKTANDTIVTDRYDTNVTYFWTTNMRTGIPILFKVREDVNDINILNSNSYSSIPAANPQVRAYLGQDAQFIYYLMSCGTTFTEHFVKVDKNSLTMTSIEAMGTYVWSSPITEDSTYIYYARKQRYGTNSIKRYNKTTAVTDTFTVSAKTSTLDFSSCFSNLLKVSDTNFYIFTVFYNTGTSKFGVTGYTFDTNQSTLANTCIENDYNITWGSVTQFPIFATNVNVHYEPFITNINGKNYLNVAIYERPGSSTVANINQYGIYTFLIDTTNKVLTFKNFLQITTDYFRGFLGLSNNTFLVVASDNTTYFLNFDSTNETFVINSQMNNQPYHIGVDKNENIWIVNTLNEVEYLSPFTPTNINITFEHDTYQFQGANISSYITVSATNYNSDYIATNLSLTIKGDAMFTSNSSKVLTTSTVDTGSIQIPITINGAGSITIYPQLIM